jgi:hypothetical protein
MVPTGLAARFGDGQYFSRNPTSADDLPLFECLVIASCHSARAVGARAIAAHSKSEAVAKALRQHLIG